MSHSLVRLAAALLFCLAGFPLRAAAATPAPARDGRVIVLGFDGADARTTERMMRAGELPNLARLAERGTFAPLLPTTPAESATGWAAINTGMNPARNGIPSFFGKDLESHDYPATRTAHTTEHARLIEELEPGGLLGLVVALGGTTLAFAGGALVFLALLFLGRLVLRRKPLVVFATALVLAVAAGWGLGRLGGWVPRTIPGVLSNNIEEDGFWAVAAEHGVPCLVIDAAVAFDREPVNGARVLAGLGLPDARGDYGQWFIYTTDEHRLGRWPVGENTFSTSGSLFRVAARDGRIETRLSGPLDFWRIDGLRKELEALEAKLESAASLTPEERRPLRQRKRELLADLARCESTPAKNAYRASVPLTVDGLGARRVRVTLDGTTQELGDGEWSDWYPLTFVMNPLLEAHAVTRVKVVNIGLGGQPFVLLVNMLECDPRDPPFWQPISQPAGFSRELAEWVGEPYKTVGWGCLTNPIKDQVLDVPLFLEDIEFNLGCRERLTLAALERDDWRVLFSLFSTPDRLQHMMYKYHDEGHPMHDPREAARVARFFGEELSLKETIPAMYRQIDRIVGEVLDHHLAPDDLLLLCADHGFTSYRRGMHVNNWLAERGYLTVKDGLDVRGTQPLEVVDWSRTRAYSLGLGMVFLNLEGREPHGIVPPGEARAVLGRIRDEFLGVHDELPDGTRVRVGVQAVIVEELYEGPYVDRCGDLMLGVAENYRVSWDTAGAQIRFLPEPAEPGELAPCFSENHSNWGGDHASVSPEVVQGIFFSSRPVRIPEGGISVLHVAPTVLEACGVPVPAGYDREGLAFD